jgi:hypothetical protein
MKQYSSKVVLTLFIVALLALGSSNHAEASGRTGASARRHLTALILEVDQKARTLLVRESYGGAIIRISIPDDVEIQLSESSPTMGHSHLILFEWAMPGMVVDLYVVPTDPLAEAKRAAQVARDAKKFSPSTSKAP